MLFDAARYGNNHESVPACLSKLRKAQELENSKARSSELRCKCNHFLRTMDHDFWIGRLAAMIVGIVVDASSESEVDDLFAANRT